MVVVVVVTVLLVWLNPSIAQRQHPLSVDILSTADGQWSTVGRRRRGRGGTSIARNGRATDIISSQPKPIVVMFVLVMTGQTKNAPTKCSLMTGALFQCLVSSMLAAIKSGEPRKGERENQVFFIEVAPLLSQKMSKPRCSLMFLFCKNQFIKHGHTLVGLWLQRRPLPRLK